ncbi:MAG: TolC family protein [Bacteroidaceae bacterium]|nr:TolC family protein [Bacteroidaceae bacterium]
MKTKVTIIALAVILTAGSANAAESWTLQRCIDYALENNIQVRQSDISAQSSDIALNTARSNRLPGVSASASQGWSFGRSLTIDNTYANTNTANTSFSIGTDVTLFAGRRMANNIQVAELSLEAAKSDLERIKDDVRVQVAQAFIQIVYNRSILDVARNQVTIDSMQVERLTALAAIGKASSAEVSSQKATLAQSRLSVTQAENNLNMSILTLTQLLELPSPEGFDIIQPGADELEFKIPDSPEAIYAEALEIKPAIKSEEIRLEQAGKNIDVAKGGFYPTLSLSAGAGTSYYTSSNFPSDPMGDQLKNNFGPHIGLNLSIPIFSRNSNRNNVRSAQLNQMNQELQLDNTKKQLYKEIQQAYYNAVASKTRYESSQEVEISAQESFELVQAKYEGGKASITEFNESKNRLVTAQADVIKYRYEYLFNTALLEFYRNSSFEL